MRTRALKLALIALMLATTLAAADDIVNLLPARNYQDQPSPLDAIDNVWLSRTLDDQPEYYLGSGALGDTLAVHYMPAAACDISTAEAMFYNSGEIQVFVWRYKNVAAVLYPTGVAPYRGTSPVSPLGEVLLGPIDVTVQGTGGWETLFDESDLPPGGLSLEQDEAFVVGFVKTVDEYPYPMSDDISSRSTSYSWFGGPWMNYADHPWGGYNAGDAIVEIMMHVDVSYPDGVPAVISEMTTYSDTPNPNKPLHIEATVTGDTDIDLVFLRLKRNEERIYTLDMSDNNIDDIFEIDFNLDGYYGDTFKYWIYVLDNNGVGSNNLDQAVTFEVVSLPNKPILYIDESSVNTETMITTIEYLGWQAAIWDINEHNGIDRFVLDREWELIVVNGFGSSLLPTRDYAGNLFEEYVTNGGDLILIDQDYLFANGESATPVFNSGDFAYDVLGLEFAYNDPVPSEYEFAGVDGSPISDTWFDYPYVIGDDPDFLWGDHVFPIMDGNEMQLFSGFELGATSAYTTTNSFGGNVAYFGFDVNQPILVEDLMPLDWRELMDNLLAWFDLETAPFSLDVIPHRTWIGPLGGTLTFDTFFENLTADSYPGMSLWTRVTNPDGSFVEPLYQMDLDVTPFLNEEFLGMTQCVPTRTCEGRFEFRISVGYYPDPLESVTFDFFKAAPPEGELAANGWDETNYQIGTDEIQKMPKRYLMTNAYPNPFNPETTLSVHLPEKNTLNVVLYNVQGQRVLEVANGSYPAGEHKLLIDGSSLASGVYFLQAIIPGQLNETQKLILMK
jgi:Secretion system C-terminal sorting domain